MTPAGRRGRRTGGARAGHAPGRGGGTVRIIGGRWRGRRLRFPPVPGLRPTPDRVRETLFNWLAPIVPGARCLDLYAGSGALGLEALSRGARELVMVEADPRAARALREHARSLDAGALEVVQAPVERFLEGPGRPFDVVFLDPPYRRGLVAPACARLEAGGWLAPEAWIYVEAERELDPLPVPANWAVHRRQHAGQVEGWLLHRRP